MIKCHKAVSNNNIIIEIALMVGQVLTYIVICIP